MFSIYDYEGRVFRNTLEELYRVNPVESSAELLKSSGEFHQDSSQAGFVAKHPVPNHTALQAYRDLIHASPKDELRHAYEIMQEEFDLLSDTSTVYEAMNTLVERQLNALPVVNDKKRIVGIFSHDLLVKTLLESESEPPNLKITPLNTCVSDKVITAEPVTSIRRIAEVMYQYNLTLIPVTDAYEALVGLISARDIAKAVANEPPVSIWT